MLGKPLDKDLQHKIDRLKAELEQVPVSPGVYLWKDAEGTVIYVGKAKALRLRMRQYLNFQDERAKIPFLVDRIDSFDYIVVENEHESLILERNLIARYSPYFNADFKDDKSYPFIALSMGDVFPAISYTRKKKTKNDLYFGPYTDSKAARYTVDILRRVVPVCASSCAQWRKLKSMLDKASAKGGDAYFATLDSLKSQKPCFDCHVSLGPGACCGLIAPEQYAQNI
ncbi:MAG: GIY-YIG nuclease family protein, partial [Eggerthellaceae bacterium]|nr:GIY-YIG nuclease family protein [Eggerthellaceae bacterium]